MPKLTVESFLSDPAHKEKRDFMSGIIDARIKEIIEQRKKKKNKSDDDDDGGNKGVSGNIFDELFGGGDDD